MSPAATASMNSLPAELLGLILLWEVRLCRYNKNAILTLRLVCKDFDTALRPYTFKTLQLDFSRFLKGVKRPRVERLVPLGHLCEALYLDMMVVRDEEEIRRLTEIFQSLADKVPEMLPLLDSLRQYCLSENTFDESDFRALLEDLLEKTPNMKRLKCSLPFQVVGHLCSTATILLATTFASLAKRPEDHKLLETLTLDHVSDTTINAICHNHMDLANAIKTFSGLKNLILSIKRQESRNTQQVSFTQYLWFLIRKAVQLESLCLIGWHTKREGASRRFHHVMSFPDWTMRSMPYSLDTGANLKCLKYLELKRLNIEPKSLVQLISEASETLKEVYLIEVYLKTFEATDGANTSMWIGHPDIEKPADCCWVADELCKMDSLKLDVLRATSLGYDDFQPDAASTNPDHDLKDPSGRDRSFDERFVEAAMGLDAANTGDIVTTSIPISNEASPESESTVSVAAPSIEEASLETARDIVTSPPKANPYDAEVHQRQHNTTSQFKRCIDGYFFNHNEQALRELQSIIAVADKGMQLISDRINRARQIRIDSMTGTLTDS